MDDLDFNHDKKVKIIEDALKSFPDGLTITDIIKKTSLARNTVLTRLYFLVGQGKVGMRQINMAKLHYWKGGDTTTFDNNSSEEKTTNELEIKMVPLEAKHIKKVYSDPEKNIERNQVPDEMFGHNEKDGDWKSEKNSISCMNLIEEVADYFEKGDLSKAKEGYKKIQKIYPLISFEAKEHLTPSIKKVTEEINKREIHLFIDKYIELGKKEGFSEKIVDKIHTLSNNLLPKEREDVQKRVIKAKAEEVKKPEPPKEELSDVEKKVQEIKAQMAAREGGATPVEEPKKEESSGVQMVESLPPIEAEEVKKPEPPKEELSDVEKKVQEIKAQMAAREGGATPVEEPKKEESSGVQMVESLPPIEAEEVKKPEPPKEDKTYDSEMSGGKKVEHKYGKLDFAAIKAEVRGGSSTTGSFEVDEGDDDENFIKTHVPGFDKLMEKGIPKGSSILMAGGCGSGKTLFTLQTLVYQANKGKKCLFMSFEETEERLINHMESFGWNARELVEKGNLVIKRFNPYDITRSVDALLMKAKGELLIDVDPIIFPENFKPDFIVVDSLTAIGSAFASKEDSYRIYIEQLFRFFEHIDATSFLITETQQIPTVFSTTGVEEFLADGVFVIYNFKRGNVRENAMEILKLRGARHKKKLAAMKVTDKGITIYPDQEVYGGAQDR